MILNGQYKIFFFLTNFIFSFKKHLIKIRPIKDNYGYSLTDSYNINHQEFFQIYSLNLILLK